ncbi:hypothetical protein [Deinococcus hopiensis]|uniref:hypothetical protein n=1 Tax=Deinococcus hopiensis TaxID=309885 RepID=UPI0009FF65F0|nr:hypothetical protein [Deinococcus hopiensis]
MGARVRRARELFKIGIPPAEAALLAGFADQAHLTRVFKRGGSAAGGLPGGGSDRMQRAAPDAI